MCQQVEISFTVKSLENLKGLVSDGTKLSVHWTKGKSEGVVPPAVVVDGKVEWQTGVSSILCHLLKNKTTHEGNEHPSCECCCSSVFFVVSSIFFLSLV